jgi:hypothetical protein
MCTYTSWRAGAEGPASRSMRLRCSSRPAGRSDSIGERVVLAEDAGHLPCLPINDARQDQVRAPASPTCLPIILSNNRFGKSIRRVQFINRCGA